MSRMHTALVTSWGKLPTYTSALIPSPAPEGWVQLRVLAAGLHKVVKSRAAGQHYSTAHTQPPHVPGIDGVGLTPTGQHVYFNTMRTGGSFSEIVNVPLAATTPLPEGLDPVKAAALLNPAMSSWMALKARTIDLPPNFTVAILGATSTSGRAAISIARAFGAGKVIGIARNTAVLSTLGLDVAIPLLDPVSSTDFSALGDVDVVLDYIYGAPFMHLMASLKSNVPTQYVQIGSMAGESAEVPSSILRSKDITMGGAGPGSWSMGALVKELPKILDALKDVEEGGIRRVKLEDVEKVWDESGDRVVFVM